MYEARYLREGKGEGGRRLAPSPPFTVKEVVSQIKGNSLVYSLFLEEEEKGHGRKRKKKGVPVVYSISERGGEERIWGRGKEEKPRPEKKKKRVKEKKERRLQLFSHFHPREEERSTANMSPGRGKEKGGESLLLLLLFSSLPSEEAGGRRKGGKRRASIRYLPLPSGEEGRGEGKEGGKCLSLPILLFFYLWREKGKR